MRTILAPACALLLSWMVLHPGYAAGQTYSSVGAGLAVPVGTLSDAVETGYTVRGQLGLSLVLADVHGQAGWTHFPGKDVTAGATTPETGAADVLHVGLGARLGVGLGWVGLNGAYFFGDGDDGIGFFPEIGLGLGPLEVVADLRIDGNAKWAGLRAGLRF